ncbi:Serine/threonine-protein kinase PrkC [Gemmata obscuriglobus]|uniref:serine/threonine-protein kinase n=1 Tax=Gemmata obscuriglobus TaxID=114 RepID=UPI00016C3E42|nr:serine/threonine-protein kinase [Gemmata obscuriglobus]QEG30933.1 Serine/threonine-protein kinase PrkC [Gemmata obscuriglobus]VTS10266.1 serine threonine protein kinase : Serine/threonine protein kinase OS=Singulisphaera acidiphila (strain ATCC BAA-1392 / DSM 18658 / VKM B-2454 / MOB10) GN=Sinac_6649 PE=3 SV=1: Pkinase: Pkinase: TPR_11: TPR_9 [Gemmata obscuriglobus UQM 2246]
MHPTRILPNAEPRGEPAFESDGTDLPTAHLPAAAPPVLTPAPRGSVGPLFVSSFSGAPSLSGSLWSDWDDSDRGGLSAGGRRPPRVGDTLCGFELVGELGRGAFARVYLARQQALAGREVALKVTQRPTHEAERLARLQHTNIVPVYSVHADQGVQLICMPFLGKVTIADLLRAHRADRSSRGAGRKTSGTRAARTTVGDNRGSGSDGRTAAPRLPAWTWAADGPPPIVGDPRAVVHALAQLAAGLSHAHQRRILHLDIKPANVLLADTGEPMLLDFNLAFDATRPDRDVVGGTMPYMAPEQLHNMRTRGTGALDDRTDLYGLGAMAFEMLTGELPFASGTRGPKVIEEQLAARLRPLPSLRARNPEVSPAVEAIVHKLLAPAPADRYQTANELCADLDRHLNDLPLAYARESSAAERFGKWRRRNPGLVVRLMVACLIGLALGLGGAVHQRAEGNARAGAVEQARAARAALDAARLDLTLVGDPSATARGVKRTEELVAAYGCDVPEWQSRPGVRRLTEAERATLAGDLGELMFLLAQVKWSETDALPESERRQRAEDAWKLNRAARDCFVPDEVPPAIERQAALIAPRVGEEVRTADLPAPLAVSGTRGAFLEAAFALRVGRYATAVPLLEALVGEQPAHGAAQFCLAYSLHQQGHYARALERYDVARALLPKDPRPLFGRGLIYGLRTKPELAEAEFTKALALDPGHAESYRNRGLVRFRLAKRDEPFASKAAAVRAKFEESVADYTAALDRGSSEFQLLLLRATSRQAFDPAGATADRTAAQALEPKTEMDYLVRGWGRRDEDPKGALADLRKAAALNPRSVVALQNQAHILADRLKDPAGALVVTKRVVELSPDFAPGRAGHAIILARLGRRTDAHKEIEQARLLSNDAAVLYQAACVYSLTSVEEPADRLEALKLLRRAIREGFTGLNQLAADPDLIPLRTQPEFQAVYSAAENLFR